MRALRFHAYGGPEQLRVDEVPEPHPGPGEVRIRVSAASINPFDGKVLGGAMSGGQELAEPMGLGFDASGVVDELGEGVTGVQVGDDVFGLGRQAQAAHAVLTSWTAKPASLDWAVAGAAGVAAETAIRALDLLGVGSGSTMLIDGGSGGVGAAAVQIAVVDDPSQVVSISNFGASEAGARTTSGGQGDKTAALAEAARLLESSQLVIKVQTFPLDRAAEGYRAIASGHTRGKI